MYWVRGGIPSKLSGSDRGGKGHTEMAAKLSEPLGDDILLFHDPVESYTYEEAVKIGCVMEITWSERPVVEPD